MHLVERVLPHVPYRQWTLSFPHRVRWVPSTLPLSCLYAHAIFVSQTLLSISKDRSYHGLLAEGRTDVPTMQRSVVRMLLG